MTERTSTVESDWLVTVRTARSIAVVGASSDKRRPGGRVVAALERFGFSGAVYPVNPGREQIQGLKCYPSLGAIGQPIDIAFILVSAEKTADVVGECAELNVRLVILGSGGFKESGPEGAALEQQLLDVLGPGMRLIGPNTNGIAWLDSGAVVSFSPALQLPDLELRHGPTAIVSQSGALGAATFTLAQAHGLDIGLMVNTGNEVDLGFEEVLNRLCQPDADTNVVLGYVEGLADSGGLVAAARSAVKAGISLALLKVGNTKTGAAAAAAHTAKLAGSDRAFDGILAQLGIVRAASLSELTAVGVALQASKPLYGSRLTVASLSGGLGIIVADAAEAADLSLPPWNSEQQATLDHLLPDYLSRGNPIDLGGGPFWDLPCLQEVLKVMDASAESDVSVLAIANFEGIQDSISDAIIEASHDLRRPLIVVWYGSAERARLALSRAGVPAYAEPVEAVRAIALIAHRSSDSAVLRSAGQVDLARRSRVAALVSRSDHDVLDADTSAIILQQYGVPAVFQRTLATHGVASEIDTFPCYVKLSSPGLTHKSDVGGVVMASNESEAQTAIDAMREIAARLELADAEILVQGRVTAGSELLVGMSQDPVFGPVVAVGLGGVLAEALDDVVIRLPVLDAADVFAMLAQLHHQALVRGFRGLPGLQSKSAVNVVVSFADLVREVGDLFDAVDLNPVIVDPTGRATAVDTLFVRRSQLDGKGSRPVRFS